ncbi:hypothetical protein BY458DRAFT_521422 [Sporodiniella umbellata]|nr:hypothetical protein BY458DRAFT_521422 [Sporodiniella umbellata]
MSLSVLTEWFEKNKIEWNKEGLTIEQVNGSFSVVASKKLKREEAIVKIPKNVVLSTKTCGISNVLDEAGLEGGCALALALMYEFAQGENSPWYGYLQALPKESLELPMFWEEEEKELFKGTEMESPVYNDLADLDDDYHDLVLPLIEEFPYVFVKGENEDSCPYSFDKFILASTTISSRAFEVDAYHENALVPFADLFNHRENEQVHFQTDFEVCEACGVAEFCEHQYFDYLEGEEEEEEEGEAWEDEEDLEEASMEEEEETELPDLEALEEKNVNFWESKEEEENKDTCDMVLDCDVQKGEEIFNTYGDHPNVALLSKYGFCYDDNKNDYISIPEDAIVDCCLAITLEIVKGQQPKASKEVWEQMAVEATRPRWELFLRYEPLLCPSKGEGKQEHDDFEEEEEEEGCCDDKDHSHGQEHGQDHEHDADGGCCGDEGSGGRPYFVNAEGLFEDKVMCLLHIMFVSESKFQAFVENVDNALEYFDDLANDKNTKSMVEVKRMVYQACHALIDFRRMDYLEESGEWKSVADAIQQRDGLEKGSKAYYAHTLRISEKKIVEKSVAYYEKMVKESLTASASSCSKNKSNSHKKQKGPQRARK